MSRYKAIRVGVLGASRGMSFAVGAGSNTGLKLVAICDSNADRLKQAEDRLKVTGYADYDKFLQHDMDAVILANYFHEHVPFAIKALKAGMHVMSETTACYTLGEGVRLVEAVEKSGRTYMFAENYPYMLFNQEMKKIYQAGKIGEFMYGEGEYVHPMSSETFNCLSPGADHWRNWLPATYYNTHSLGPVMYITDTMPKKVNGFVIPRFDDDPMWHETARPNDTASMITIRMDNGAVVKTIQCILRGHGNWVRIHGTRGQVENLRHGDANMVRLRREQFEGPATEPTEQIYTPTLPRKHQRAMQAGHGGGDYFMNHHFAEAIRTGKPPFLDVYRGVAMSAVGILAYRSAINDSNTFDIPDFRNKSIRTKLRNDEWGFYPGKHKKGDPWASIEGKITPSKKAMAHARKDWKKYGYDL